MRRFNETHSSGGNLTLHWQALPERFRVGDCEFREVLSSSDVGIRYLGWEHKLRQQVAIQEFLPAGLAIRQSDAQVVPQSSSVEQEFHDQLGRFLSEAGALASFQHPNIVRVLQAIKANGTGFVVMESVEGETLSAKLQRTRTLDNSEFEALFLPLLSCLESLHDAGLLHQDLKPDNIVIGVDRSPTLLAYGVPNSGSTAARQVFEDRSRNRGVARTLSNYSPVELYTTQARRGAWTDIYSLGATMYHCITGVAPPAATERILEDTIGLLANTNREGGYHLQTLAGIDAALGVRPESRPSSLSEWRSALSGAALGKPPTQSKRKFVKVAARGNLPLRLENSEKSTSAHRSPRWSLPAISLTGASILIAYVDTGVLRPPAGSEATDTNPVNKTLSLDGSSLLFSRLAAPPRDLDPSLSPMSQLSAGATLVIKTEPSQAEVILDGQFVGRTPLKLVNQPPGSFDITLLHPNYENMRLPAQSVSARQELLIERSMTPAKGSLRITTEPPGAWVEQDGQRLLSSTPGIVRDLPVGPVELTIGAAGHRPITVYTEVPKNETGYLARSLQVQPGS